MDAPEQIYGSNTAYLSRFDKDSLYEIKKRNDKEGGRREWLSNVYMIDGKYKLGEPTFGNYSGILVSPSEIMTKDTNVCKLSGSGKCDRGKQLLTTIHMHPIRTFAEEGRRQNFSGVDIASEFCKARDEDKEYTLFLTYPKLGLTNRKNRIKAVVFPNRDVVLKAMAASNPGVDPTTITVEGRDKVNWIEFQKSLKELGYIEEIEIEPTVGAPPTTNLNLIGMIVIGAVAVGGLLYWNKVRKEQSSPVEGTTQ